MYLKLTILALLVSFSFDVSNSINFNPQGKVSRKIVVDHSGRGDFVKLQQAIDSIPPNNKDWVGIILKSGVYNEKVCIPKNKPFIVLEGEGSRNTLIQWGESGHAIESTTFTVLAEHFVARNITFRNTYGRVIPRKDGVPLKWAPAFRVAADKCSFYQCGFIGLQDTLTDQTGRHYFEGCYIEGVLDFIWGSGQSYYQGCRIHVLGDFLSGTPTYITAQARLSGEAPGGYVFNYGTVVGTGKTYLGRAYNRYSRVLFHRTHLSSVVVPQGWDIWQQKGNESTITYSERLCYGRGSDKSKRVPWEKELSKEEWAKFVNVTTYINQDGWIQKQPTYPIQ